MCLPVSIAGGGLGGRGRGEVTSVSNKPISLMDHTTCWAADYLLMIIIIYYTICSIRVLY